MKGSVGVAAVVLMLSVASPVHSQSIADLVERLKPSVAFVLVTGEQQKVSGTSFVVHQQGLLATALHVVEDARDIMVQLHGGQSFAADVVATNAENDLAILRIPRTDLVALTLLDPASIRQGDEVLVVGYPLANLLGNYEVTVTRGIVSAVRTQLGLIQVDAAMNPGVSGGPVVNLRGDVVGVAVSAVRTSQQVNFASPSWAVKTMLDVLSVQAVAELPKLQLPLTRPREIELKASKSLSAGAVGTELGVACTSPPPFARAITAVSGNLNVPGNLMAITWLSLREGAQANDRGAFGHLYADRRFNPDFTEKRFSFSVDNLNLPPVPVCSNYTYRSPTLCINCLFGARYSILYKVPIGGAP